MAGEEEVAASTAVMKNNALVVEGGFLPNSVAVYTSN